MALCFLTEELGRNTRKNPESWIEGGKLDALHADLRFYRIRIQKFTAYCRVHRIKECFDIEDALDAWRGQNVAAFDSLYQYYSKEVEHLLLAIGTSCCASTLHWRNF